MEVEAKKALLNSSLERAAAVLGDITPHVYALYYERWPEAKDSFDALYPGGRHNLEGEMASQVLYCLMEWYDSPGEIEIILLSTIPHHIETLHVDPRHFSELIIAVCDTIVGTIPPSETGQRAVWDELRTTMLEMFAQGISYVRMPQRPTGA